jgi:hypothetical protein
MSLPREKSIAMQLIIFLFYMHTNYIALPDDLPDNSFYLSYLFS